MMARVGAALLLSALVVVAYAPVVEFAFLNWDDPRVIVSNAALTAPDVTAWAFTTFHLEHYQPLSWLVWAGVARAGGLDPAAFHAANVAAHLLAVLACWAAARVLFAAILSARGPWALDAAALLAALVFGVHPLRVEVVAWISALPYALALAGLLASCALALRASTTGSRAAEAGALAAFGLSLLARPVGVGFPAVLVIVDVWLLGRAVRPSLVRAVPYAALAAAAALVESLARAPGVNELPWLLRLEAAAAAPFVYLWRTVAPVQLTPLDVLPLAPEPRPAVLALAAGALVLVSAAAWRARHRRPALPAAWFAYLALLLPAAGLVSSGVQATADRYAYVPGVVIALALTGGAARAVRVLRTPGAARAAAVAVVAIAVALTASTRAATAPWADSVALWTRAAALDPANDVAVYNLAHALAEAGRPDEAAARYRDVLALVPGHADARANLDLLDAARLEREGNDLASRGDLATAAERYAQAIALDPRRTHAHAARGIALMTLGRDAEARPALEEAVRQGAPDPAVPNALGVLLVRDGRAREARRVFEAALARHPNDAGLAINLARLLATTPVDEGGDAGLALRLASAVVDATGGREPRALDALAVALAGNGRRAEAAATAERAAALAAARGDRELAVQITARSRAYRGPGR
ncbi:MAG: tetratricopeptide repeat protein [Acidobacteriota bacterium]